MNNILGPILLNDVHSHLLWCVRQQNEQLAFRALIVSKIWSYLVSTLLKELQELKPNDMSYSPSRQVSIKKNDEKEEQEMKMRELVQTIDNIIFFSAKNTSIMSSQSDQQQEEEQGMYSMVASHILKGLAQCLIQSHRFAKTFNQNHVQRNVLWRTDFHERSLCCALRILFRLYSDETRLECWPTVEQKIMSVCYGALEYYLSLEADIHRENWSPLMILILSKLYKLSDEKFCSHTSTYYRLLCDLIRYDLKPQLREALRRVFIRIGYNFNINNNPNNPSKHLS